MDHHCPYLGNCIGYHNRKFFILFLFYINLSVLLSLSILSLKVYPIIMDLIYIDWKILIENYKIIPTFLLYLLVFVFQGIIFSFFKYHIDLISNNKNTQEILNSKRQNSNSPQISLDLYNVNIKENWFQVLGTNPWLWALPMFGESGRPKGNGLKWKFNNLELTMTEQIITHRTQTNQNQISDMIQQEQRV